MVVRTFQPQAAIDAATGELIKFETSGQVFDVADEALTAPLTVILAGDVESTSVPIGSTGQTALVKVEDHTVVLFAAGGMVARIYSLDAFAADSAASAAAAMGAQTAAIGAQEAAEGAQSAAASLAAGVVRTINGNAPDEAGNIVVSGGGGSTGGAVTSVAGKTGDVSLVKGDVGLAQVDNVPDVSKPVSGPQSAALAAKMHTHSTSEVSGLQVALDSKAGVNAVVNASQVNAGSGTINGARLAGVVKTVNGVTPDGAGNVNVAGGGGGGDVLSVNGKTGAVALNAADVGALPDTYTPPVTTVNGATGAVVLNKTNVGLWNVDNTTDAEKPISGPQQAALNTKADDAGVVKLAGNQAVAGVKTFSSAPVVPDGAFTQAKVNGLSAALLAKLDASKVAINPSSTSGLADGTIILRTA